MLDGLKKRMPERWRRSERLKGWLVEATDRKVVAGPFAGLRYVDESRGSAYWPKLLGTYEREIVETIERAIAREPDRVLVAGAAEGYYAVGLATRMPQAEVIAWEPDGASRELLRELAARNGAADRVRMGTICDLPALGAELAGSSRPFLLMDVDGSEAVLLDPRVEPRLLAADVLVETHDCFVPGVADEIAARFEASHEVRRIEATPRSSDQVTGVEVPVAWRGALEQLLSERRPPGNDWLWLERRA